MKYFYLKKESDEPYDWHKQIWRFFPGYDDRRFVFMAGGNELLVVAERPPEGISYDEISFPKGRVKLTSVACPVVRRSGTRKLEPIKDDDELMEWIIRSLKGFDVISENSTVIKPLFFTKNGRRCVAHRVVFNVDACVKTVTEARRTVERGIGKHKFVGLGAIIFPEVMI